MTKLKLTKLRMRNRIWEGRISGACHAEKPNVLVTYRDQPVTGVTLQKSNDPGLWDIFISVPTHAVADGVHTIVISDGQSHAQLGNFSLIAGEAETDDLRAEVELLRAELDMLKRAFRRLYLDSKTGPGNSPVKRQIFACDAQVAEPTDQTTRLEATKVEVSEPTQQKKRSGIRRKG
ncbi:hypothetical protein [Pontibaca salina]|uniref:hypothetical protein n=1 Tax=Pontibaca salina TaxID=2795731 RepID=UPI002FCDDDBF